MVKNNISKTIFSDESWTIDKSPTILELHAPIMHKSKDGSCNPLFFKTRRSFSTHGRYGN